MSETPPNLLDIHSWLMSAPQAMILPFPRRKVRKAATEDEILAAAAAILERRLIKNRRNVFKDPAAVKQFLTTKLRELDIEHFMLLFLDNQHRLICSEVISQGTIDGASVYPRTVIQAALKHGAAAIICSHNHPSGVAEPSAADRTLTERLKAALATVDVRMLDHFVIGEQVVSFAERGWI